MTTYSQGGFELNHSDSEIVREIRRKPMLKRTKADLKRAVAADASAVLFVGTSMFGGGFSGYVSELPIGHTLTIVGPDPYTRRNWYANIVRTSDGKVRVS